jgi:hypothetical protein
LTIVLILIIGLAWIAFLGPTILRARNRQGRSDSVGDFHHRLTLLGRTNGRHRDKAPQGAGTSSQHPMYAPQGAARPMTSVQRRRRDVLLVLTALAALTFVAAVMLRTVPIIFLNLVADVALVVYLFMLVQAGHRAREHRVKVRFVNPSYRPRAPYVRDPTDRAGTSTGNGPRLVPLRQTAAR